MATGRAPLVQVVCERFKIGAAGTVCPRGRVGPMAPWPVLAEPLSARKQLVYWVPLRETNAVLAVRGLPRCSVASHTWNEAAALAVGLPCRGDADRSEAPSPPPARGSSAIATAVTAAQPQRSQTVASQVRGGAP